MQPCSREMQGGINSFLTPTTTTNNNNNHSQISLQDLHHHHHNTTTTQIQNSPTINHHHHHQQQLNTPQFDPSSHDDFLEQMLSSLPSFWDPNSSLNPDHLSAETTPDNVAAFPFDEHATLASKFRNHQITSPTSKAAALMLQQHLLQMPANDVVVDATNFFKSPNPGGEASASASVQALYNGFTGSLNGTQPQHFQHPLQGNSNPIQGQNFAATNQAPPASGSAGGGGGNPGQAKPRVRARRGQATDPHSIAERLRRERIAERMKALQELVPNANKTDKASMLDEIIDYVKFLQLQVKVLSMSRLGGAAAVAPLVADISSEGGGGGGDCVTNGGGGVLPRSTTTAASTSNDSLTMTEHQVAKLMEEDMGSAMQYLQGKGLCLMPISLATAISTATCHTRSPLINQIPNNGANLASNGEGPSSPNMSVLTVQSAVAGNDSTVKDVSKP